jgi:hypothetical protein
VDEAVMVAVICDRRPQYAQIVPVELTGIHWLLPMHCNSTAVPWLPEMVLLVLMVSGSM